MELFQFLIFWETEHTDLTPQLGLRQTFSKIFGTTAIPC